MGHDTKYNTLSIEPWFVIGLTELHSQRDEGCSFEGSNCQSPFAAPHFREAGRLKEAGSNYLELGLVVRL